MEYTVMLSYTSLKDIIDCLQKGKSDTDMLEEWFIYQEEQKWASTVVIFQKKTPRAVPSEKNYQRPVLMWAWSGNWGLPLIVFPGQDPDYLVRCFFSLYFNDISTDIDSEIRLVADDCVCYREIKDTGDALKFEKDINQLGCWARKWGMRFQPVKCK